MDTILFDELLQEIFLRLPPPSSATVPLVSKRWLRLYRSSRSHLSLFLNPSFLDTENNNINNKYDKKSEPEPESKRNKSPIRVRLVSFLSYFPFLTSLSLSSAVFSGAATDSLLLSVAASCPNLRRLRLLTGPVSAFPLLSLSTSCPNLLSLSISLSRPISLHWLLFFPSLKDLSLNFNSRDKTRVIDYPIIDNSSFDSIELKLETLTLSCIRRDDHGLDWLYKSCKSLNKLQLKSCEGLGEKNSSNSSFVNCVKNLREFELRACRTIINDVLLVLADNCELLKSLLVYDGGCREGLLRFIDRSHCDLEKLDFRLPLDLDNRHLLAISTKFPKLASLKLQSCCLVTGEGLKAVCSGSRNGIEELALISCDVVDRESGLLTSLGQSSKKLKKLDLSYNELLMDKEIVSMLASCGELKELGLRGCNGLSDYVLVSMLKCCKDLEIVDLMHCSGIGAQGVEMLVTNSRVLKQLNIEESKLSNTTYRSW